MSKQILDNLEELEKTEWCQFLIDWGKGKDHIKPSVIQAATGWKTCAVGELGDAVRWGTDDAPLDLGLFALGAEFADVIADEEWAEAALIYIEICARVKVLNIFPENIAARGDAIDDDDIPF